MSSPLDTTVESYISEWRSYANRRRELHTADVDELEGHLRDQVDSLAAAGLTGDEAFLVAVKRMGSLDAISREFARDHSSRLWKQLVLTPGGASAESSSSWLEARVAIALAIAAAAAFKLPALFGLALDDPNVGFYARNASFFVLPLLTAFFVWKRGLDPRRWLLLALPFIVAAAIANLYPFPQPVLENGRLVERPLAMTEVLTILHLPIALWLVVGLAYTGHRWANAEGRMDFVRFTGELFIYYALIALGGIVLTGFTVMMFEAIGLQAEWLVQGWVVPCGALGAVIIGSWLVEAKQSVIENMAPVLTRIFTPLFVLLLLTFLGTMAYTRSVVDVERNVLIGFDLLLVLILGLVLYAISARDPDAAPNGFDTLQLVLVVCAVLVDVVALAAIAARISAFGFSPNKVAALGENLILLVNLGWSAWLYAGFIRGRTRFAALERWQTGYLPVYSAWAAFVAVVFPVAFRWV